MGYGKKSNSIIKIDNKELSTQFSAKLTDRAYYISSSYRGTDIADVLQNALNDVNIGSVSIPVGDYSLSHKVTIPDGKTLIMKGLDEPNNLTNVEASNKVFTKITPTFDGDYCFKISNRSQIISGFIDCSPMTSGGGIQIDFSQVSLSRINIKNTILYANNKWNLNAVYLNGDRPSGTTPGNAYFINIDIGAWGFGVGVYLKRLDTYTVADATTNGIAWATGLRITGNMQGCQRYVYFNTSSNIWAGNSSIIKVRMQGTWVPDANIPAIEVGGVDSILDCQFHDIGSTATNQKVKLKLNNTNDMMILKGASKGDSDIIDTGANTAYLKTGVAKQITSILTGESILNSWYVVSGGMCTVHFQITQLKVSTAWTTIFNLPFNAKYQTRDIAISDTFNFVNVMANVNQLQIINNNANPLNISFTLAYPII